MATEERAPAPEAYEREIAEITREIEARRASIERERGIEEEKEVIREVVQEKFTPEGAPQNASEIPLQAQQDDAGASYLDSLDPEHAEKVASLVNTLEAKGIRKALTAAQEETPFILDAFHDALVDKLYNELKERGVIT